MMVTMHRAVVYRAYPTREQAALIERTCGCARFVYNRMLADKIAHYEKTGEMLKVTPARYKREFPWLKEVDSFALCNAQLNLDAAYRNFFRRVKAGEKHGFPKYKTKHRSRCCYKTNFVNGNIRFEGDERYLRLPKLGKSTMDNGFGMFRALLGYKLEDRGKRLVTVGRLFPSSQLCHECGYRFSGTKDLSVREWTCPLCGRTHDRDVNAARNIRDEGMRLALSA